MNNTDKSIIIFLSGIAALGVFIALFIVWSNYESDRAVHARWQGTIYTSTGLTLPINEPTQGNNLILAPSLVAPDVTEVQLYSKGKLLGNLCKDGKPGKVDLDTFCREYKEVQK